MKSLEKLYAMIRGLLDDKNDLSDSEKPEIGEWMLDKFMQDFPNHAQSNYDRAILAHSRGDNEKAGFYFERAVELNPGVHHFEKGLGDFYHVVQGRIDVALVQYKKALSLKPKDLNTLLACGHLCVSLRHFEAARDYYQQVLIIDPENMDARQFLNHLTRHFEKEVVRVLPDQPYHGSKDLIQDGTKDETIRTLENILIKEPEHSFAHNDLGVLYLEQGSLDKAYSHLEIAARLEPENAVFVKNLADFYFHQKMDIQKALEKYVQALTIDPMDLEALMSLGHVCMTLDKHEDARVFFKKVLEIDPWHNEAGNFMEMLNNQSSGIGKTTEELYAEAQAKVNSGDTEGALLCLQGIIAQDPAHALAYNDLGVLSYTQGRKAESLRYYEQAARLHPDSPNFLKNLADFYFVEQGRAEDALTIYVRLLEKDREDVDCLMAAGTICERLGQADDARIFYERVLEIDPWNPVSKKALDGLDGPTDENRVDVRQKMAV